MNNEKCNVVFYGLSTCAYCRRARAFLESNHVDFKLHEVDLAQGDEQKSLLEKVRQYNPGISFPTIVINDDKVVVGFQPEVLTRELGL